MPTLCRCLLRDFLSTVFLQYAASVISAVLPILIYGVTLLGSYRRLSDNEISTDLEAIKAANRGISSKNLPNAENRGYGIYTSKRMLVEGLEGQYLMISGGCLYVKSPKFDGFYSLPENLRWDGTIISLRIPYANENFNYVKYLE